MKIKKPNPKFLPVGAILLGVIYYTLLAPQLMTAATGFAKYPLAARQLLDGSMANERMLDFSPLYLKAHLLLQQNGLSPAIIIWIQIGLTLCSAGFFFALLSRFLPRGWALAGMGIFLTNPSIILYTFALEPEAFLIFTFLGFLHWAHRRPQWSALPTGIFLALGILVRPNLIPLVIITPMFYALSNSGVASMKWLRRTALFLIPVALMFIGLGVRNMQATGEFSLLPMNPGVVFYEGNNPLSGGDSGSYPPMVQDYTGQFSDEIDYQHAIYRTFARIADPDMKSTNHYWTAKAWAFIKDHPGHALHRALTKLRFIFHDHRRHDLHNVFWQDDHVVKRLPSFPVGILSAFALAGLALTLLQPRRFGLIIGAYGLQILVMTIVYASDRQRVVILPLTMLFALIAAHRLITLPSGASHPSRNRIPRLAVLLIVGVTAYFFMQPFDLIRDESHLWRRFARAKGYQALAVRERAAGEHERAAFHNTLALALVPYKDEGTALADLRYQGRPPLAAALHIPRPSATTPSAIYDEAILLFLNEDRKEALQRFTMLRNNETKFNRRFIHSSLPSYYLARLALQTGDTRTALSHLTAALAQNPGDPWTLALTHALTKDPLPRRNLFRYYDPVTGHFLLGKAFVAAGRFPEALASFQFIARNLPDYRRNRLHLSLTYQSLGDNKAATRELIKALGISRDPVFRHDDFVAIAEEFQHDHADNPQAAILMKEVRSWAGLPSEGKEKE